MYNRVRRVAKLEKQFGTVAGKPPILFVVSSVGCRLALDRDRCIEILCECGVLPRVLPTGPTFGIVNLLEVPKGLNAKEAERYLRDLEGKRCQKRLTHLTENYMVR